MNEFIHVRGQEATEPKQEQNTVHLSFDFIYQGLKKKDVGEAA